MDAIHRAPPRERFSPARESAKVHRIMTEAPTSLEIARASKRRGADPLSIAAAVFFVRPSCC